MSRTKNRTHSLKARIKRSFKERPFTYAYFLKNRPPARKKEDKSIMEMWENYLSFTRLEF